MLIAGLGLLLAAFLVLTWQVQSTGPLVVLDGVVNARLARLRTRPVLAGFAWLTQVGTGAAGVMAVLVAAALLWADGRTRLIGPLWLALAGAQVTTWSLKFVTARVRPPFLDGVTAASPSFPSAHATVATAVYGFVALATAQGVPMADRWLVYACAVLLVVLIAFSRILLSLHYLTDVVAGALVGGFWLTLCWHLSGW